MATPATLDFEKLLAPISDKHPTGEDLRISQSPIYYDIKDRARTNRDIENRPHKHEEEEANWISIAEDGQKIICELSKDLEIAVYLIEALLRLDNFAGLRDGFRLTRLLIENFWDHLYPPQEGDKVATKVAHLDRLNGLLITPINKIPLTSDSDTGSFSFSDYIVMRNKNETSNLADFRQATRQVIAANPGYYMNLKEDIDQCIKEFDNLNEVLKKTCGTEPAPASSDIYDGLEKFQSLVATIIEENPATQKQSDQESPVADQPAASNQESALTMTMTMPNQPPLISNAPQTRAQAFATLQDLAAYFRSQEPHSPISYLLDQAVRWGHLALPELIQELIDDEKSRNNYFKLTGILPTGKSDEE